jgi:hypothetical protein
MERTADDVLNQISKHPGFVKCADILLTLLGNLENDPQNEKYRKIRVTNPKLQEHLFSVDGAHDYLRALGWQDDGEHMVIRDVNVAVLQPSLDVLRALRDSLQSANPTTPSTTNPIAEERKKEIARKQAEQKAEKERLLASAKEDREARAGRRTVASSSQELPQNRGGAAITRFSDIGVDLNRGGG